MGAHPSTERLIGYSQFKSVKQKLELLNQIPNEKRTKYFLGEQEPLQALPKFASEAKLRNLESAKHETLELVAALGPSAYQIEYQQNLENTNREQLSRNFRSQGSHSTLSNIMEKRNSSWVRKKAIPRKNISNIRVKIV